jgi:hypothetical protein
MAIVRSRPWPFKRDQSSPLYRNFINPTFDLYMAHLINAIENQLVQALVYKITMNCMNVQILDD